MLENVHEWHGISGNWTSIGCASYNDHSLGQATRAKITRCASTRGNSLIIWIRWARNVCRLKKNKIWLWTVVNHFSQGILAWVLGDRSAETFKPLWNTVRCWHSFFYVTDGYKVYPMFINDGDSFVSKTYMTRVEGENTRLRHYLARLHRKTLCYSKSENMLKYSIRLLLHYLKFRTICLSA